MPVGEDASCSKSVRVCPQRTGEGANVPHRKRGGHSAGSTQNEREEGDERNPPETPDVDTAETGETRDKRYSRSPGKRWQNRQTSSKTDRGQKKIKERLKSVKSERKERLSLSTLQKNVFNCKGRLRIIICQQSSQSRSQCTSF